MMESTKIFQIIIKWTARVLNALTLSFILFFIFAHILGDAEKGNGFTDHNEMVLFAFFPILTIVGLALAWKWEMIGGVISFTSMLIALSMLNPNLSEMLKEPQFLLIALPGLLHICHAWIKRKTQDVS